MHDPESIEVGMSMFQLASRLYPICRSLTGDGVRQTLKIIGEKIPLKIEEIPTGTSVFDWTIPKEWNINDASIIDPTGKKIVDFQNHNLHILNYSVPVLKKINREDLKRHLFTLPDQPNLIPYRTSYYHENWGFCLPHNQYEELADGDFKVHIDADLSDGSLTYGELFIPGNTTEEILFSAHICHPSLANDNLSGISLITHLAENLSGTRNRFSYRFLFIPGTIGAITWLAKNHHNLDKIKGGIVVSLVGDEAPFHYKRSRTGDTMIDRVVVRALKELNTHHKILDFSPYGYDERQFCSPGINLPVGNLTRSTFGSFAAYHTSADNLDFISPEALGESFYVYKNIVEFLEADRFYLNLLPKGEPQLGKRGLYDAIGGMSDKKGAQMAMLWLLNLCDGHHSIRDISERSGIRRDQMEEVATLLLEKGLLKELR